MISGLRKIYSLFVLAALDAFKDKNVPGWLKDHPAFENKSEIKKVFPFVGIPNFKDKVKYGASDLTTLEATERMEEEIPKILKELEDVIYPIMDQIDDDDNYKNDLEIFYEILRQTRIGIYNADHIDNKGKIKLALPDNIVVGGKTVFRAGESIFQAFNKVAILHEKLKGKYPKLAEQDKIKLPNIDSLPSVKTFNKVNIPNKEYYVVFSGSGDEGTWDVATMSMRGIQSCQNWNNEEYKTCLIGSVLSKYVGIIYLTSGSDFENMGSRMLKRSIVRFGINKKTKEKVIMLDHMYPEYDAEVGQLFVDALQKRTSLPVLDYGKKMLGVKTDLPSIFDIEIPGEKEIEKLDRKFHPYTADTGFPTKSIEQKPSKPESQYGTIKFLEQVRQQISKDVKSELDTYEFNDSKKSLASSTINYVLDPEFKKIIEQLSNSPFGHDISVSYVKSKMNKIFDKYYDADIEQILNLAFPHRKHWNIEQHINNLGLTVGDIRYIFEVGLRIYKKKFNNAITVLQDMFE